MQPAWHARAANCLSSNLKALNYINLNFLLPYHMNIFPLVVAAPAPGLVGVAGCCAALTWGGSRQERVEVGRRGGGSMCRAPTPHFGGVGWAGVQHHAGVLVAREEAAAVCTACVAEVPLASWCVLWIAHSAVLVKTETQKSESWDMAGRSFGTIFFKEAGLQQTCFSENLPAIFFCLMK